MQVGDRATSHRLAARRVLKTLAWGGLLLAVAYFSWRGIWRGINDSGDLAVGYSATRAWISGQDPYDVVALKRELSAAGGADVASSPQLDRLLNVYLPTTLPAFVPVAILQWPVARLLALTINVGGTALIVLGLIRLLGWRPSQPRALALMAFLIALAPLHTTIASGQTAIVSTAALVAGLLLERARHRTLSGMLFGLATVLKVQLGLPFLAYLVWRRRFVAAGAAGAVVVGSSVLAVGWMQLTGVPWLASWLANVGALSGPGGINDPSPLNADRFSLINLQVLLFNFVPNGDWVNALTYGLVGAAAVAFAWLGRGRERELLAVSIVAVLGLLVTYHRYYDAVLLSLPIAWGVSALSGPRKHEGLAVLVLSADFLLPFQTALHAMEESRAVPAWLVDSGLWESVLITQHTWALVGMAVVLVFAAARERLAPLRAD